jgi:SAM-dependent methyltransferase
MTDEALGSSFRDPSGYLFFRDGVLLRRVETSYASHYDQLMESGLYAKLVERGLLIPHSEVDDPAAAGAHRTLKPERVPFISHPYEWSFSQLQDAAITTLKIAKTALDFGMILKDASAYNVQFHQGKPIFIDTLSFEKYSEGSPWVAYRQFCQHFLAPLSLMSYRDIRLQQLLRVHIDGIPLDLARTLLPTRAWFNVNLFMHIRLHAGYQRRHQDATEAVQVRKIPQKSLENMLATLQSAVRGLQWKAAGTEWAEYTSGNSYSEDASEHKRTVISGYLDRVKPASVWDLGANTGTFSRLATERGIPTLAFDIDPACVDRNYRAARKAKETKLLPLLLDLTNPSPAIGWAHGERASFVERGSADLVMALALIHHLTISNNVPLERVADLFAQLAGRVIIEFVPKDDPKVQQLLANREDVFPDYTEAGFETAFKRRFEIEDRTSVQGSKRTLYLLRRLSG